MPTLPYAVIPRKFALTSLMSANNRGSPTHADFACIDVVARDLLLCSDDPPRKRPPLYHQCSRGRFRAAQQRLRSDRMLRCQFTPAEIVPGLAQIGGDLRAKLGGPAEFFFVAQALPKTHLEPRVGYLPREIK
jgi:hypothetical protein